LILQIEHSPESFNFIWVAGVIYNHFKLKSGWQVMPDLISDKSSITKDQ